MEERDQERETPRPAEHRPAVLSRDCRLRERTRMGRLTQVHKRGVVWDRGIRRTRTAMPAVPMFNRDMPSMWEW